MSAACGASCLCPFNTIRSEPTILGWISQTGRSVIEVTCAEQFWGPAQASPLPFIQTDPPVLGRIIIQHTHSLHSGSGSSTATTGRRSEPPSAGAPPP